MFIIDRLDLIGLNISIYILYEKQKIKYFAFRICIELDIIMKRLKGYKLYFWILQWGMFHTYKPRVLTKATFCFFRFWHHRCCIGSQNNLMVINPLTHSTWENQILQLFKLSTAPDQERIKMGLYIIRAQKRENQNDYRITSSNGKPYFFLSKDLSWQKFSWYSCFKVIQGPGTFRKGRRELNRCPTWLSSIFHHPENSREI